MFYHPVLHPSCHALLHSILIPPLTLSLSLSCSPLTIALSLSLTQPLALTPSGVPPHPPRATPPSFHLIPVDGLMDISIDLISLGLSGSNGCIVREYFYLYLTKSCQSMQTLVTICVHQSLWVFFFYITVL